MNIAQGSLTIIDLGTPNVKYFWKGTLLTEIIKVFIHKGTSLTITHNGLPEVIKQEMKDYGIKIKEVK